LDLDVEGWKFLHYDGQFLEDNRGSGKGNMAVAVEVDVVEDEVLSDEIGGILEYLREGRGTMVDGGIGVVGALFDSGYGRRGWAWNRALNYDLDPSVQGFFFDAAVIVQRAAAAEAVHSQEQAVGPAFEFQIVTYDLSPLL